MGLSLSRLGRWADPTTASGRRNLFTVGAPGLALGNASLGDPLGLDAGVQREQAARRARDAEARAAAEQQFFADLGQRYGEINPDDPRVRAYYERAVADRDPAIMRTAYESGDQAAAGEARRGMAHSGYAGAAQQSIWSQAAAERSRMRAAALQEGIGDTRQSVMGEAQVHSMGTPLIMQAVSTAEAAYQAQLAAEEARRKEALSAIGAIGGFALGGPVGAGVGSKLGGGSGLPAGYYQPQGWEDGGAGYYEDPWPQEWTG